MFEIKNCGMLRHPSTRKLCFTCCRSFCNCIFALAETLLCAVLGKSCGYKCHYLKILMMCHYNYSDVGNSELVKLILNFLNWVFLCALLYNFANCFFTNSSFWRIQLIYIYNAVIVPNSRIYGTTQNCTLFTICYIGSL